MIYLESVGSLQAQRLEALTNATLLQAESSFADLLLSELSQPLALSFSGPSAGSSSTFGGSLPGSVGEGIARPVAQRETHEVSSPQVSKQRLVELADRTAKKYGVSPRLVRSVISAESGFNPDAVSRAGAEGLMQLMPTTAAELGVKNPMNPQQNVDGGVRYLKQMLDRYGGNVKLALAAYNAGPGAVDRAGGVPDYRETQAYVQRVLRDDLNEMV